MPQDLLQQQQRQRQRQRQQQRCGKQWSAQEGGWVGRPSTEANTKRTKKIKTQGWLQQPQNLLFWKFPV